MYTKAKQKSLYERLCRYENRLKQWGIAVASGAALFVAPVAAKGQVIFTEQTGSDNPLNIKSNPLAKRDIGYESVPTFADIDDDGDLDAFVGELNGKIKYFQNIGSSTGAVFVEQTGINNPLNSVDLLGYYTLLPPAVAFVDIDGDNDLDAFIGEVYGTVKYFQNVGSIGSPVFAEQTGINNPLDGINIGYGSTPTLVDIDGDGDLDAFIGEFYGNINYFQNIGSSSNPIFAEQTGTDNPLDGIDVGNFSAPILVDIDGDGDLDAFIGKQDGTISYFRNTGSSNSPVFVEQTGTDNPLDGRNVGARSKPAFADIDGDGDLDAFIGEFDGNINYFQNIGSSNNPTFQSPDIGGCSAPTFADIDSDTDLDAFIGDVYGNISYFKNVGSSNNPVFEKQTGTDNPFDGIDVGTSSAPTFVDIDGDGDLDAFIGESDGNINYFQNTGSSSNPIFVDKSPVKVNIRSAPTFVDIDGDGDLDAFVGDEIGINYFRNTGSSNSPNFIKQTGVSNPFDGMNVGFRVKPTFVDIDNDGDFDAFFGEFDGNILYFQNIGNSTSPVFDTRITNPFGLTGVGDLLSSISFVDIDNDGDLDAFTGESGGNINYFRNTGSNSSPIFVEQTGVNNPFDGIDAGTTSVPTFADIDGDGDFDAFIGLLFGTIKYFTNTGSSSSPVFVEQTGINNPLDIGYLSYSTPTFVDIDGDGDLDAFVGEFNGSILYFQNTGNSTSPVLVRQIGINNPFGGIVEGISVGSNSTPNFVDIDGDSDFDAFIGKQDGTINYFQNTGSSSSGNLVEQTGANNPLNGIDVGDFSAPILVDIDIDGDLDALIGTQNGTISYFQNTGSSINGIFVEQTGMGNPFNGIDIGDSSTPTFADIDGDGDLDAFTGGSNGTIRYFQNTSPIIPVELIAFTGKATKAGNQLLWQTASELNNKGFNVERSTNAKDWKTIGFVQGNGTTVEQHNYEFLDNSPVSGIQYYRLKQLDFDGQFEYSDILAVNLDSKTANNDLMVFPNPVQESLTIVNGEGLATLYNALGQVVQQFQIANAPFQIELTHLPTGIYTLQIQKADGTVAVQQVVK